MIKYLTTLILLLVMNFAGAQSKTYDVLWKKVEQFEIDGLPKSALEIVNDISAKAKTDSNDPQIIKSLLYKSKFALVLEEDARLNIINDLKAEIGKSKVPLNNILENILANLYWQYFQQNRYKFYNRTKTENKVDENDFRTWDLETLFNEIHIYFQRSLKNEAILQLERLVNYDDILVLQDQSKLYRPALYDILAHNALNFYKTSENSISRPAYKFKLEDPNYLSDAKNFAGLIITSKDSTALQLNALKIYQDLIRFHLKNKEPYALEDVNIARLKFVKHNAVFNNKDSLFLEALKTEALRLGSHKTAALYNFEIATVYYDQGQSYQPETNETYRWKLKEALDICNTIIKKFPVSKGTEKCSVLKRQILQSTMEIRAENILPVQQNARLLVRYKNLKQLDFKVFKITRSQLEQLHRTYRKEEQLDLIKGLKRTTQWQSKLRDENDFQTHSTEIVFPKLDNGSYVILATTNGLSAFAFKTIQVTDMALVEKNNKTQQIYQLINRNNGEPIAGAKVNLSYKKSYNGTTIHKQLTTDPQGEFRIKKPSNRSFSNVKIKVSFKTDKAYFGDYYINRHYRDKEEKLIHKAFVFTDRSIYRPGQTVYFKGITLKSKDNKSEVLPSEKILATLLNVNREIVSQLELTTNEFGSVSGSFILPGETLTGEFSIEFLSKSGKFRMFKSFSVEEYKRPKFKTNFNPVTETYRVNDSITVNGEALAYAGSHITDAKVVYRVHRKVQYPRWYYWYRPWFNTEPQEITHGETITGNNGVFNITFKALPDDSADKSSLPVFHYEITADVTDINGETRSATTIVNVGYHALIASISVDDKLDSSKNEHTVTIDTKNLNGEFVPATGTVKIYKLQAPGQVLRSRPWKAPDYQDISEEEFKKLFPHDPYHNEDNSNNWKKGKLVLEKAFDTQKSKAVALGRIKNWASGQYIIVLESKDKFGQLVKDEVKTTVFNNNDKTISDNELFNISANQQSYNTDDTVELCIASAANNITVTIDIEKNRNIINTYVFQLNNDKSQFSIPVTKEDLGGFAVHYSFAAFNGFRAGTIIINVPYPKTELEIETTTFRDKLQPGQEETWTFNIKGPKGDKVSAELLAGMYDASLDQFKTHQWNFNPIHRPLYNAYSRSRGRGFGTQNFRTHLYNTPVNYPHQNYDRLNWFGFSMTNANWIRHQYLRSIRNKLESTYNSNIKKGHVSGKIVDEEGLPLPGVNVNVKGTTRGTQTDFDGNFNLEVKKGDILVFSFVGYTSIEFTVDNKNSLKISMNPVSAHLDEVVVTAYSTNEKRSLTASVGIVQGESTSIELDDESELNEEISIDASDKASFDNVQIRKNLNETAFFYPDLKTDKDGNVSFSFTTPEALTRWKLQLLAHTKSLESATTSLEAVTQKELMVIPNAPRFLREGDRITISSKISNLSENKLEGQAVLQLFDAITGNAIDTKLGNAENNKAFAVDSKGNTQVSWNLIIPDDIQAVQYKIIAKAGDFSDGEQNALPVLSNRMLVTETLPMWIRSNQTRTFTLDKLKTNTSTSLKHHKLTLEMTSNPAWYAIQALPYLMEYPYDCNEQIFSRYYANALASHIANSNPRIQEVFDQWRSSDVLMSNLEKNAELKSILIQETPWLRDAQSETEQKKRIALLFDLNKMKSELKSAKRKLKNNQMSSGAWAWFNGGYENRYITQHIISGFGHLKQLKVSQSAAEGSSEKQMIKNAIRYLDREFVKEYKDIRKYNADVDLSKDHLSYTQLHYLYMRSFYPEIKLSKEAEVIRSYYFGQIQKYWLSRSLYAKGLMALIMHRKGDTKMAGKILKSLKENSISSDELGMYWKENSSSWYWYQAPIETQALLIEAFSEIENDTQTIDNLKIWLLKNKQTNGWKTTKATTEAVYALLLQGSDWLSVTDMVDVIIGDGPISPSQLENVKIEAGTGYYKTSWNPSEIKPQMADVKISKKGKGIAWGSLYWQYFEDLDKITSAKTPLQLKKKLFLRQHMDTGEELSEITNSSHLIVGDLLRVRIELKVDRPMEFVHMKDMRASGLEPINVLSGYKWQDGLGYYESTKDASTNFFFDLLPKGVYVFEYDLRVNNAGDFSNGITTIQSMYAPEFSSHSEGVRVNVK